MVVGEPVAQDKLRGRRHGVLVLDRDDCVWFDGARTRRGARKRYLEILDWLPVNAQRAHAPPGAAVELIRVERERVAQRMLIHSPGDLPPDAGIREPRRPQPSAGGAAAVADPPDA